ncbi:MAG TPA: hypothetical protein VGM06_16675 [Polyangiaceae bacterium]|jgi:hypothetical protein
MNTRLLATRIASGSTLAASVLASTACTVQTTAAPPPMGQLTVDWTIDESTDPNLCSQSAAVSLHIHVDEVTGNAVGDFSFDCTAGGGTIDLDQRNYEAQAWFEDSGGANRTPMDSIPTFAITSVPVSVSVDFPANSFN